jgi:hypothetical protein
MLRFAVPGINATVVVSPAVPERACLRGAIIKGPGQAPGFFMPSRGNLMNHASPEKLYCSEKTSWTVRPRKN